MAKDLFSVQSADYARYRPSYPAALIDYIADFVIEKKMAWDCATGNGQAALLLTAYFEKVMATDLSEKQLLQAKLHPAIVYHCAPAEQSGFAANSFDLITIAQAYHWFRFTDFEKEVRRVAKPGAVMAAWGYSLPVCNSRAIDQLLMHFYTQVVGPYWDVERKYVEERYQTVPFGYAPLPSKTFSMTVHWSQADLQGYLHSWSSVQHFLKDRNYDPVKEMAEQLTAVWPDELAIVPFEFPIFLRMGRV